MIELTDERNALERAMLHFSHLEKKTEKVSNDRYKITLYYDKDDETELLNKSFGVRTCNESNGAGNRLSSR